jgi:hypothetical protein
MKRIDSYGFTTTAWKVPRVLHERVILQSITCAIDFLHEMPYYLLPLSLFVLLKSELTSSTATITLICSKHALEMKIRCWVQKTLVADENLGWTWTFVNLDAR